MTEYPPIFEEFANYKLTVQNRSKLTVEQYLTDLSLFFKFLQCYRRAKRFTMDEFGAQSLDKVDLEMVRSVQSGEILAFVGWTASEKENKPAARARKLSAIRSFYKYLTGTRRYFEKNPAADIESPRVKQALPKFLTLDESLHLLETIEQDSESKNRVRDYCMITLFLNCGMRLSELVGISLSDIDPTLRSLRVVGKGSKERMIYLNEACKSAITEWMKVRTAMSEIKDKNALFVSSRGLRISNQTVQHVVYKYLEKAGLSNRKLSTHKLRHTAATLMYQEGGVDVRVLKEILGHEQLNTTQIYTHVSNAQIEDAMAQNPLAKKKQK